MKTVQLKKPAAIKKLLSIVLLCSLIFGVTVIGTSNTAYAAFDELSPADLYEENVNSTVGITISAKTTSRYGYGYTYEASGSGFIISDDGYVLTNYHVISGYDKVTVATYDQETYDATVIGYDESSDIAVLKIEAENLKPVTLGDSGKLRVGDTVYAIGNPLGELTFSLTRGIVSALSRNISTESITNAKFSSSGSMEAEIDNIGFAIPINSVKRIVTSIIENGYVLKPYIGIAVSPLSEESAGIIGIKSGAVVQDVTADAPADKAGIKVNDVITKVDDKVIRDSTDLVQVIADTDPGEIVTFSIYRQGKELTLPVEVGSKTESALKNEEAAADAEESETQQEQQNQPNGSENQHGMPNWGSDEFGNFEDFFKYFFGY